LAIAATATWRCESDIWPKCRSSANAKSCIGLWCRRPLSFSREVWIY
jgi:hypothetical protein